MKIHIEIVTGFLGAGKTSFINSFLKESQVDGEKVLIFQLEDGIKKIIERNNLVKVKVVSRVDELKEELIHSIYKYDPNRIIIEYNGTSNLKDLFKILNEKIYKECSKVSTIFCVVDGRNVNQYIENLGSFIIPFIQYSNMIVVNNIDYCNKESIIEEIKKLRRINPNAYILKVNNKYVLNSSLKESKVIDNGFIKKMKIKISNNKNFNRKWRGNEEML